MNDLESRENAVRRSAALRRLGDPTAVTTTYQRRGHQTESLEAQRMAPSPASALFLGKAIANMLFVLVVEAVLAPIFIVFFNLHALGNLWLLALILPLGTWALVVNGTFFAALGLRARNRELLLPLLLPSSSSSSFFFSPRRRCQCEPSLHFTVPHL